MGHLTFFFEHMGHLTLERFAACLVEAPKFFLQKDEYMYGVLNEYMYGVLNEIYLRNFFTNGCNFSRRM